MANHILWVDTETTGLDPDLCGVHQVAGVIDSFPLSKDSLAVGSFNIKANCIDAGCQVSHWTEKVKFENVEHEVQKNALEVSGVTIEQVQGYPPYHGSFYDMVEEFKKYVDQYDKNDKFILAGYNVGYDKDMLFGWAKHIGFKYLGAFIDHRVIDVQSIARAAYAMGLFPEEPKDFKLETLCQLFGIEINAHDALSDIEGTRSLFFALTDLIKFSSVPVKTSDQLKQDIERTFKEYLYYENGETFAGLPQGETWFDFTVNRLYNHVEVSISWYPGQGPKKIIADIGENEIEALERIYHRVKELKQRAVECLQN